MLLTPKFNAELAGEEGIEYSWAHAKAFYRHLPVLQKQGHDNFKQLVKESTCPSDILTKVSIEKFALRARTYICPCHHIEEEKNKRKLNAPVAHIVEEQGANVAGLPSCDNSVPNPMLSQLLVYGEIEWISKAFKGLMCALDFDPGFVNSKLREVMDENINEM